jgi:hypothetical protein
MWKYKDEEFTEDMITEKMVGFVYLITNLSNGKKYVGQKKFGARRKVSRKGKRAKRVYKKSDWQTYFGSNGDLQKDVEVLGEKHFLREILYLCESKAVMNYLELQEQIDRRALLNPDEYYNSYCGGRISRKQLTSLIE